MEVYLRYVAKLLSGKITLSLNQTCMCLVIMRRTSLHNKGFIFTSCKNTENTKDYLNVDFDRELAFSELANKRQSRKMV